MKIQFSICALILITNLSCASSSDKASRPSTEWYQNMHSLSEALSNLVVMIYSPNEFNDPRNFVTIDKNVKVLRQQAHKVNMRGQSPDLDVTIEFVAGEFASQMELISEELADGNRLSGRYHLQQVVHFCIQCHTRTSQGQQSFKLELGESFSRMPVIHQAEFFAATRDFDAAIEKFDKALTNPSLALNQPWEWMDGVRESLAIAIKAKRNPSLALELVSRLFDERSVPQQFKEDTRSWRSSIKDWQQFEIRSQKKPLTRQEKLKEGQALLEQALQKRHPRFPIVNNSGFVHLLRSTTLFHDVLNSGSQDEMQTQALYSLGVVSEVLNDLRSLPAAETYFESCIRLGPYSLTKKDCYYRLERQVMNQYLSGMLQGESVPEPVQLRLKRLREQAKVD